MKFIKGKYRFASIALRAKRVPAFFVLHVINISNQSVVWQLRKELSWPHISKLVSLLLEAELLSSLPLVFLLLEAELFN